jgi:hypothetical protein
MLLAFGIACALFEARGSGQGKWLTRRWSRAHRFHDDDLGHARGAKVE